MTFADGCERAGRVVVGLWLVSALSLMVAQVRDLRETRPEHPEIPGADPAATAQVIEACRRQLGPRDRLGLVYAEVGDEVQLFLSYRLPYVLHPLPVYQYPYADGGRENAFAAARAQRVTHVFDIGGHGPIPPGATLAAEMPRGRLLRLDAEGPL